MNTMTKKNNSRSRYISKKEIETLATFPIDDFSLQMYNTLINAYRKRKRIDRIYLIDKIILKPDKNDYDINKIARQMIIVISDFIKIQKQEEKLENYERCQVIKDFIFESVDYFLDISNSGYIKQKINYSLAAQIAKDINYLTNHQ